MIEFLRFAVLGVGAGALYALAAMGLVVIYRSTGVINFAQGATGMFCTYIYWWLWQEHGLPFGFALAIAFVIAAAMGLAIYHIIMRPLRSSSALSKIVATLGILLLLEGVAATLFPTTNTIVLPSLLPTRSWHLGGIVIGSDRVILLLAGVVLTVVLWWLYRRTHFGLMTSAVAENERNASALGFSPNLVSGVNWALGGVLAAVAGIFLSPITGLDVEQLTLLVIPSLAVAMVGGLTSIPLTFAGGLVVGILESELGRFSSAPGLSSSVPFFVILLILLVRGTALPIRGFRAAHLPRVGTGRIRVVPILASVAIAIVLVTTVFNDNWQGATTTTAGWALILLSMVVVTGYAGQISLVQVGLAGVGALIGSHLSQSFGIPFPLIILIMIPIAFVLGLLIGLPALRTRGINLAIATLALAVAIDQFVFQNPSYTGQFAGINVKDPTLFGLDLNPILYPGRYAIFALVVFVLVALVVANVRRGRMGRPAAGRAVERASRRVARHQRARGQVVRLRAGQRRGRHRRSHPGLREPDRRVHHIRPHVVDQRGGVRRARGHRFPDRTAVRHVLRGRGLRHATAELPRPGRRDDLQHLRRRPRPADLAPGLRRDRRHEHQVLHEAPADDSPASRTPHSGCPVLDSRAGRTRVEPQTLDVENLSVSFGGTVALSGVSLSVSPGEVLGLIGPNGAGKTTFIDAVTGYVRPRTGTVTLGGGELNGVRPEQRVRRGLTRSFQSVELFEDLSVRDNLLGASDEHGMRAFLRDVVAPPRKAVLPDATVTAIQDFGVGDYLTSSPTEIPYGVRRLVGVVRAVSTRPRC